MTITHRALSESEAQRLHDELRTTPNILGYTVRELVRHRGVLAAERDGQFAGACLRVDLAFGWTEIAALYVLPEHRGFGLGKALFDAAWDQAASQGRGVYVLSRNPQVIGWMREKGMRIDRKFWAAPLGFHLYMLPYSCSWHRNAEAWRKRRAIKECPPMVQGRWRAHPPIRPR